PPLADHRLIEVEAAGGQVLSKHPGVQRPGQLSLPPVVVLPRVGIDGLVHTAVDLPVRLLVAIHVHPPQRNPSADWLLPDAGRDLCAGVAARGGGPGVDREEFGKGAAYFDPPQPLLRPYATARSRTCA